MAIVTAVREFDYNGTTIAKGRCFDMPPRDAAIHARKQNVSLTVRKDITADTLAADESIDTPRPRRRYRRRDLTAEP